ncbi:MAG: hypothetical protein OXB88_03615 [Bacteriovoracales bacterium]|nr:hypothetical protein [Bacteriovoracales bacterium]
MRLLFAIVLCTFLSPSFSQNLMKERIWKLDGRKKSIYHKKGVFHLGSQENASRLMGIRHSYGKVRGYERIVFDFETNGPPRTYGHLSESKRKLYIDFFDSTIDPSVQFPGKSRYVKSVNFFPDGEMLSAEITFNDSIDAEMFFLTGKGRFIIDVK